VELVVIDYLTIDAQLLSEARIAKKLVDGAT
jgi:hypothetical protein